MKHFTVTGYYPDNAQPWATSVQAEDYEQAEVLAKREIAESLYYERHGAFDLHRKTPEAIALGTEVLAEDTDEIRTTGVIEGQHMVCGGDFEHGA